MSEVINIKELSERIERESVFVDTLRQEMGKVIVGQSNTQKFLVRHTHGADLVRAQIAIVITAAVADAVSIFVKGKSGDEDYSIRKIGDRLRVFSRLADAEFSFLKRLKVAHKIELHLTLCLTAAGKRAGDSACPCRVKDGPKVDLRTLGIKEKHQLDAVK